MKRIFTLTSAIHLQLRLGGREVYAIFVDFKRVFDFIPHKALWKKLPRLGISPKLICTIYYDKANIRVKNQNTFSEKFEVTEGVL